MKRAKKWLIAAAVLMLAGAVVFVVEMTVLEWDFSRLSNPRYECVTHHIDQLFDSIFIDTDEADITMALAEDGEARVVAEETEKIKYAVSVEEGTLRICLVDEKAWYDYINLFSTTPKMTVYLPSRIYDSLTIKESTGDIQIPKSVSFGCLDIEISTGDITLLANVMEQAKIKTSTGDISVENQTAGALTLRTTTGDVTVKKVHCLGNIDVSVRTGKTLMSGVTCQSLTSKGTTGDLQMQDVIAKGQFSIRRSTGDVTFDLCDAQELSVEMTTGDVKGTLCSAKVFVVKSSTGDVDVPTSGDGGVCEITTTTGDIKIEIVKGSKD